MVEEFYNIFGPELKAVTGDPRHIEDVLKRVDTLVKPIEEVPLFSSLHFFTLLAQEQGLCNSWASVRPSLCPIRQRQRRPAGLLLSAGVCSRYLSIAAGAVLQTRRRSEANAGSVMLGADGGGSVQTFRRLIISESCLQCFDAVGWAAGRASGL